MIEKEVLNIPRLLALLVSIGVLTKGSIGERTMKCQDVDKQACLLFQKAKPDLCSDSTLSTTGCIRLCGNCPLECYDCPNPVKQPSECTTALCGVNQTCMLKQYTRSDGQAEFAMKCEDKELCEGLLQGFYNVPVGKRHLTSDQRGEWNSSIKRDVSLSLSCCDTDFCNFPKISTATSATTTKATATATSATTTKATASATSATTTKATATATSATTTKVTATATTIAPTSPGPFPNGCNRDIVFVLNDSGSVGSTNFRHALDFVKEIVRQLDIGPTKAQVAMLTFSSQTQINWYLNKYTRKQDLLSAVDMVRYHGGVTHTNAALQTVRNQLLTQAHGDRQMAKNVVIVLTDGQSNDKADTIREAGTLHLISDDVISIAIGSGINAQQIQAIATDNHHVFDLRSYSALNTIFNNLMQTICNA